jgi:uncharacterized membrane protein
MFAVRYVALAALVVWVGGMLILAWVVAPAMVRALGDTDPINGHLHAGLAFNAILQQFHLVAYACGAILIASLFLMKFVGPPPSAFVPRASVAALMLAIALYSGIRVTRDMVQVESEITGPVNHLAAADPRRVRFEQLHRTSTTLMAVNTTLGLLLLFWYARE